MNRIDYKHKLSSFPQSLTKPGCLNGSGIECVYIGYNYNSILEFLLEDRGFFHYKCVKNDIVFSMGEYVGLIAKISINE